MRPPTLIKPLSSIGRNFTNLLERFTLPRFSKSFISSENTSFWANFTMATAESFKPSAVRCLVSSNLSSLLRHLRYSLNFYTQPILLRRTVHNEYLVSISRNFSGPVVTNIGFSFFISGSLSGKVSISSFGHSSLGFKRNAGPPNDLSEVKN